MDWEQNRLTVWAQKTNRRRVVPIAPELSPILRDAFENAPEREPLVVCGVIAPNVWRDFGVKRLKSLPLSRRLIRELHAKLMNSVRGGQATRGELRRVQNWIGPPACMQAKATYVPPSPGDLMSCLGALEKSLHTHDLPVLMHAAMVHYQFEAIHPFLDGHGRVGRLLITLMLVERRVTPSPGCT